MAATMPMIARGLKPSLFGEWAAAEGAAGRIVIVGVVGVVDVILMKDSRCYVLVRLPYMVGVRR